MNPTGPDSARAYYRRLDIIARSNISSKKPGTPHGEPLVLVAGERGRTATTGGFLVYGGLLIDERHLADLARAADIGEMIDHDILAAAAAYGARLIANLILAVIATPNPHDPDTGTGAVVNRARNIAGQWRRPLLMAAPEGACLAPVATRIVAMLARGIGALEEGRADPDLAGVLGLFPVAASTGRRNHAALTTRPVKVSIAQYRNRYHRLMKAIDAVR